ncbi:hypothetical protein [Niallia taxi]|uniref:hypothetical protein n=1 Tax=Niallia taxi TaxID=2499688 RepID=UPI002E1D4C60|nr:hypothetical protein [Niallia taxi]
MAQPIRLLDEVIEALKGLNGYVTLLDITEKIIERNVMDFNAKVLFREQIRGTV